MLTYVVLERGQVLSLKSAAGANELLLWRCNDVVHPCAVVDKANAVSFRRPCCMICCNSSRRKRAETPGALISNDKRGDQGHDAMLLSSVRLQRCRRGKPLCAHSAIAPLGVYTLEVAAERSEYYFHLLHAFRCRFGQGLRAKRASEYTRIQCCPLFPVVGAWGKHVEI